MIKMETKQKIIEKNLSRNRLFLQIQFLRDRRMSARKFLLKIVQMRLTIRDHRKQTASGVIVLLVFLEMVGKLLNFFGQNRNLNFGRTRVFIVDGHFLDYLAFLFCR